MDDNSKIDLNFLNKCLKNGHWAERLGYEAHEMAVTMVQYEIDSFASICATLERARNDCPFSEFIDEDFKGARECFDELTDHMLRYLREYLH